MDVAKINKAVMECLGWAKVATSHNGYSTGSRQCEDGRTAYRFEFSPMTDAAQAFELVERFRLKIMPSTLGDISPLGWTVQGLKGVTAYRETHIDLKIAICLCVLKMHGINPEEL